MKFQYLALPVLLLTSGCVTTHTNWVERVDGNALQVIAQSGPGWHSVSVTNTETPWRGDLAGGPSKFKARQGFLQDVAEDEMERLCGKDGYTVKPDPMFVMVDRDYSAVGNAFGVIGSVIANEMAKANSESINLPVSGHFQFDCPALDKKDAKDA